MVFNTVTISAAITPTVVAAAVSHVTNRKPLREKPTAHSSYHLGLKLVRRFVEYSSAHTVEELQAFTSQWVPVPRWVKVEQVTISDEKLLEAAKRLQSQLGPKGIELVGGTQWWQWRRDDTPLKAEWIEMREDYAHRKSTDGECKRIILYVHGGAYYFGSVDEHRYQMQRHARKLKARLLAPEYRLAPQFPFPCGLQDCLASYLYLLEHYPPSTILLSGDSAGGGMVLSMLIILRDQGLPMPAGATLLSPWADLTCSFPSVGGDAPLDYIPANGFVHKPSMAWPPPSDDDVIAMRMATRNSKEDRPPTSASKASGSSKKERRQERKDAVKGYSLTTLDAAKAAEGAPEGVTKQSIDSVLRSGSETMTTKVFCELDGKLVEIKDQIQIYAPNHLIIHPLVSPILQPSLGGLPPLLIQSGGGELLRDEHIYLAHKAANPSLYAPRAEIRAHFDPNGSEVNKHKPTDVHFQTWDDICHVGHTLSWTRPAKYMYRSVAQFGAWALARAQKTSIDILDDDDISDVGTSSSDEEPEPKPDESDGAPALPTFGSVRAGTIIGRAGDPLPPFKDHMIRQRVDRHGNIHDLPPPSSIAALNLSPEEIGLPKPGPISKWMTAQNKTNTRFAKQKRRVQKERAAEMKAGYEAFEGETPPPSALAGRRLKSGVDAERKKGRSWGMSMWSGWGSKHDKMTIMRERRAPTPADVDQSQQTSEQMTDKARPRSRARSSISHRGRPSIGKSPTRYRAVSDEGQADTTRLIASEDSVKPVSRAHHDFLSPDDIPTIIPASDTNSTRPTHDGIAYPFKLRVDGAEGREVNASTVTLPGTPALMSPQSERTNPMEAISTEKLAPGDVNLHPSKSVNRSTSSTIPGTPLRGHERPNPDHDSEKESALKEEEKSVTVQNGINHNGREGEKAEQRPPMDRFVTAQQELLS